jgi:hypothetical protein
MCVATVNFFTIALTPRAVLDNAIPCNPIEGAKEESPDGEVLSVPCVPFFSVPDLKIKSVVDMNRCVATYCYVEEAELIV